MKIINYLFAVCPIIIFNFFNNSFSQVNTEFRGVWLTNVASNVLTSDQAIIEAMDYLSSVGINVVFPVVYNGGYTLYPSDIMLREFGKATLPDYAFSSRDFLERLIIEAHRNGIEVIPWFEYGFATSYSSNGGHILQKYPQWALKDNSGTLVVKNGFDWMSAIHPGAQNFIISLMMEVIDKYDVDGVQGDDRLPAMPVEGGYEDYTVNLYKSEHNNQSPPSDYTNYNWKLWRANKLTQFLSRLKDSVRSRGSYLILSSSPTPYPWGYDEYLQDSKTWAKNNLVDNIIPQLYRYDYSNYLSALNQSLTLIRNENPSIYFAGVLGKSGSWTIDTTLLSQIIKANRNNSVKGESIFFYEAFRHNNNFIGNYLKDKYYSKSALLPYRNGKNFRPKATIVNEDDNTVVKKGNWSIIQFAGYKGYIIRTSETNAYVSLEYYFDVPFEAYFDVYVWLFTSTTAFNNVRYVAYSSADSVVKRINQSNTTLKGWQKLATVYLNKGYKKVLKIDNTDLIAGKSIFADAAMIMINRKKSPNVVVGIEKDDNRTKNYEKEKINYFISEAYPNPFNSSTNIKIYTEENKQFELEIFDITGKAINEKIIVEAFKGENIYKVNFDNKPSGVYFIKVSDKSFRSIKKIIFLK